MVYVGAHKSIVGGVLNTIKHTVNNLNGNAVQIFNGSNRSCKLSSKTKLTSEQKQEIKKYVTDNDISLIIHSIYLLNLCRTDIDFMLDNLINDVETAAEIGASAVVLHTGCKLKLDNDIAYQNMHDNVVNVIEKTKDNKTLILLETPAGQGTQIASTLEDFAKLYNMFSNEHKKRLGVCIDTAHIFASGIDVSSEVELSKYLNQFDKLIGNKCIKLFHVNDSKKPLDSHRDIHENLGMGYIFKQPESLKLLVKFADKHNIPLILETKGDRYKAEIKLMQFLATN